jgi:hypothetical protein
MYWRACWYACGVFNGGFYVADGRLNDCNSVVGMNADRIVIVLSRNAKQ